MTPIQKLLHDPSIQEPLETLQALCDQYELFRSESFALLNPEAAAADLKRRIESASPAEAKTLADELQAVSNPAVRELQISHQREGWRQWQAVREATIKFLDTAAGILERIKGEAVAAETAFFAEHGLPRETTGVSRKCTEALSRCNELANAYRNPQPSISRDLPNARNLAVFGWLNIDLG